MSNEAPTDALRLATRFHETYERLAPSFGYETRQDTKKFDPETPNGRLMVAVCAELAAAPASPLPGGGCLGAEHLSAAITRLTQVVAGDEVEASYADFTFPGHTFRADIRALLSALPAAPTGEPK